MAPDVASLHLHPIKSCRGLEVPSADLDRYGFVGDRRWMIVDERGSFITQRTNPRLASITVTEANGTLSLAANDFPPLNVAAAPADAALRMVTVWRDTVHALDLGDTVAAWLKSVIGSPARLVTAAPDYIRGVPRNHQPGDEVSFADAFPLLIISEASLTELNDRLDFPVPMDRFRPNIVVRGCAAHAEDAWKRIQIGDCILRAAGPCGRCIVTTTDQETLERGKEPLRTLAGYRRGTDGEVNFGQNYINESKSGRIDRGMRITVLD